jgi:hypothetical protein
MPPTPLSIKLFSFGCHFPGIWVWRKMAKAFMNRGYTATDENGAS